ncbi:MAG: histidine kinase [Nevskia sp.]
MDLRLHLMLRIALTAAACLLLATAAVLWRSGRDLDRAAHAAADTAGRLIEARLLERSLCYAAAGPSGDLAHLLEPALASGLCLRFVPDDGRNPVSSCRGWDRGGDAAPRAFKALLGPLRASREAVHELLVQGHRRGRVIAIPDPDYELAEAWRVVEPMLALATLILAALCTLTWFTIGRALQPARRLLDTLGEMERGELSARAPQFRLRELDRISGGLNRLVERLQRSLAERAELSARLVRVQEDERRHLARDLHDEFGQCLAGINALASVMAQSAGARCPELVPQAQRIAAITGRMMSLLESMLTRLRPPELDELGLAESLRALVTGWAGRGLGSTRYRLDIAADVERLPDPLAVTVYRVVQEGLTNAAKHADAGQVSVRVGRDEQAARLVVEIEDDGSARAAVVPGRGLGGMRERLEALGGSLSLVPAEGRGLRLRAELPLPSPGRAAP